LLAADGSVDICVRSDSFENDREVSMVLSYDVVDLPSILQH